MLNTTSSPFPLLDTVQVRSTQTLSLLSEALKLSLLLSKSPDPALNDEAVQLIESTQAEKLRCAVLLAQIMRLDVGEAEELVKQLDRSYVESRTEGDSSAAAAAAGADAQGHATAGAANGEEEEEEEEELEDDDMEDVSAG